MYKIVETRSTKTGNSCYTLYKDETMIKDSFNVAVIKALLGRNFTRIFNKRIVKEC